MKNYLNDFGSIILNSLEIVDYAKREFKLKAEPTQTEACILKRSKEMNKTALDRVSDVFKSYKDESKFLI